MSKLTNLLASILIIGAPTIISNISDSANSIHSISNRLNAFPFVSKVSGISNNEYIQNIVTSQNNNVYAWSRGNLFKSEDGQNFKNVFSNKITSIAVKNDDVFVGTEENLFKSHKNLGYSIVDEMFTGKKILDIVISNTDIVYIATNSGLFQSTAENNYIKISNEVITNLVISETGVIYIIHENCLDKSDDGKEWVNIYKDGKYNLSKVAIGPEGIISVVVNTLNNDYLCLIKNDGTPTKISPKLGTIYKVKTTINKVIIIATSQGLYYKSGKNPFILYEPFLKTHVSSFSIEQNRRAYIALPYKGVYVIDLLKNLVRVNKPDYCNILDNHKLIYNHSQSLDLKATYLSDATLNTQGLDITSRNIKLNQGKYELKLTINKNYKSFLSIFGGDVNNGVIIYNFEIKDNINSNIIFYHPSANNTIMEQGLISNAGNTKGSEVIQTRDKTYLGEHFAKLKIDISDDINSLIDYKNSYYISGTVDESKNDFHAKGHKQIVKNHLEIKCDGIYHFHLTDFVGNSYDSFLELGEKNNNKIRGNLTNIEVNNLANELNVKISAHNPEEKETILQWLYKYKALADKEFKRSIRQNGKGFDIKISEAPGLYKSFLNPIIYFNSQTKPAINYDSLNSAVYDLANNKLHGGLENLNANQYNVDTRNVVNKRTLDNFSNWINNYKNYISDNKDEILNKISRIATRGFGSDKQIELIKNKISIIKDFNERYLEKIEWTKILKTRNFNYLQLIKLNYLQKQVINQVNIDFPKINRMYQQYLQEAINNVQMHGYKVQDIMENKELPQTKEEIDKYNNNQSFSDWLQKTATNKFHKWQLTIGLSIGIPLLIIFLLPIIYWYCWYTQKYNPKDYRMYKILDRADRKRYNKKKRKKWRIL